MDRPCAHALRISLLLLLALAPGVAHGQVFGQYTGARTLQPNQHLMGAYIHASDNVLGALGQLRLSFFPGIDFGFQGGLSRVHLPVGDRTILRFGTDIKGAVARTDESTPLAVAVGAGVGVEASDGFSSITLAPGAVVSRDLSWAGKVNVTPFAGTAIAFTRRTLGSTEESDVTVPIRLGSELEMESSARFAFEIQLLLGNDLGDDFQIVAGAHFPF